MTTHHRLGFSYSAADLERFATLVAVFQERGIRYEVTQDAVGIDLIWQEGF